MHILPNISRSKGIQAIKFVELIECNKRNIFLENHAENEAGRLVPDLFFFKKKHEVKASVLQLSFNIFC